jgi:sec-independent protein translocase protein TatB
MFGLGFTEILVIAIIAILFLGPDKLPSTMIEIAKFFKHAKNTIGSMKESLEEEMNVREIKDEALAYKKELLAAGNNIKSATDVRQMAAKLTSLDDDDFIDDGFFEEPKNKPEEVTLQKKTNSQDNVTIKKEEDNKNV